MATKTISLELDAYDKLKAAKRSEKESFSSVVRRAHFAAVPSTGAAILARMKELGSAGLLPSDTSLTYLETASLEDSRSPRISPSPWNEPA